MANSPAKAKPAAKPKKKKNTGGLSFQLSYGGLVGVVVVGICLFCWMFLFGVWAGQTILLPVDGVRKGVPEKSQQTEPRLIQPEAKKKPAS